MNAKARTWGDIKRRSRLAKEEILKLIPEHPNSIKSKELEKLAIKNRISSATLFRHLPDFVDDKLVIKEIKFFSEIHYSRTPLAKFELQMLEIQKLLDEAISKKENIKEFVNNYRKKWLDAARARAIDEMLKEASKYFWVIGGIIDASHRLLFEVMRTENMLPYPHDNLFVGLLKKNDKTILQIKPSSEDDLRQFDMFES